MAAEFQIVECPRDAMQGWPHFIATSDKIRYINSLLSCGFHTLDCGSFVSPKVIPQMADTAEVINNLTNQTTSELLTIIANFQGAELACGYSNIQNLGFPFSVSPTFQLRNTNSTIEVSLERVKDILALCKQWNKQLVVYLSMAFGNPYGDPYSEQDVFDWAQKISDMGVTIISLADTVGIASPLQVHDITAFLVKNLPAVTVGVHLHSTAENRVAKLEAALSAGCTRFDGALKGIGGCPMAGNDLVGNLDSQWINEHLTTIGINTGIDPHQLKESVKIADEIFV